MRKLLQSLLPLGLLLYTASCDRLAHTDYPREETLYVGGMQWGSPETFNPLDWWSAFPVMAGGNNNIMYEQLLNFNALTGEILPLLASLHEKNTDHISVLMNPAAAWSDGKPLTARDVVFTYELSKKYEGVPTSYVWEYLSAITVDTLVDSTGSRERLSFVMTGAKRINPLSVLSILQSVRIVPRHVIEAKLKEYDDDFGRLQSDRMDKAPVISGPYRLADYTPERIVLERRDDYWGNQAMHGGRKPAPRYIIHPILKNNGHFSLALQKGELDISATFIPRIWDKKPYGVRTWYAKQPYYIASSIPMLVLNVTKAPLNDVAVRRAIAYSINHLDIANLAVSGYSNTLNAGLILPFGAEAQFFSKEDVAEYGALFNPEKARQILAESGYKSIYAGGRLDHMTDREGKKVPTIQIMSPAGWSDWEAIVRLAVRDMRAVGIDAREKFIDEGMYWTSQPNGEFDAMMHTPAAEANPASLLSRFEAVVSSRDWAPIGERMNENYGRYNQPGSREFNPAVDSLINVIPLIADQEELVNAYRRLNVIFMQDQPAIPLVYRPEQFYQYSLKVWDNFPDESNPYAPPQVPTVGAARDMLWKLTKSQ